MTISTFDKNFSMIRDGKVQCNVVHDVKNKPCAQFVINDQFVHTFSSKSRISEAAVMNGPQAVEQRYNNGKFFFHGDELVSMKDGFHNGFCHSDENIAQMIEHIGFTDQFDRSIRRTNQAQSIRLQNVFSNVELTVPQYATGGEFNSELSYVWDPFQAHINAAFRLIRLVCTNGMVGMSDFMNTKIPVVNEWLEHMRIANKQIQNKVGSMVEQRMAVMSQQRATVRDCIRVVNACRDRLDSDYNKNRPETVQRLRDIMLVCDPILHLRGHYNDNVFNDGNLADQCASHLTQFTVWNMLTEMASHTYSTGGNSDTAIHLHANRLLIDGDRCASIIQNGINRSNIATKFEDVDAAFAGDLI